MVPRDHNHASDIFVHNMTTGKTVLVSRSSTGEQGKSDSFFPFISANGQFVLFSSNASNLVAGDTNDQTDAFVRDLSAETTTIVSVSSSGVLGDQYSCCSKGISDDGRYVAFRSFADNLVDGDTNGVLDVFLHDLLTGVTTRVSVSSTSPSTKRQKLSTFFR